MTDDEYDGFKKGPAKNLETAILKRKLALGDKNFTDVETAGEDSETVLSRYPGQYDAMLGVITKVNWSLTSDGGYDCTVTAISPNQLTMELPMESNLLGGTVTTGYYKSKKSKEWKPGKEATTKSISDVESLLILMQNYVNNGTPPDKQKVQETETETKVTKGDDGREEVETTEIKKSVGASMVKIGDERYFIRDPQNISKIIYEDKKMDREEIGRVKVGKKKQTFACIRRNDSVTERGNEPEVKQEWQQDGGASVIAFNGMARRGEGAETKYTKELFVSWGWIEDVIIQTLSPRSEDGKPITSVQSTFETQKDGETYYADNQCLNHPVISSFDTSVCYLTGKQKNALDMLKNFLPSQAADILKDRSTGYIKTYPEDTLAPKETFNGDHGGGMINGSIRKIMVNAKHITKVAQTNKTVEGFLTTILNDINIACGRPWKFSLKASGDDSHVLQVVDKNYAGAADGFGESKSGMEDPENDGKTYTPPSQTLTNSHKDHQNTVGASGTMDHYMFKGRGVGNILKGITLNSKLPKSIQAMAFMSNKAASTGTPSKGAGDFNIYGCSVRDDFYVSNLPKKDPKEEYEKKLKNMADTYNSFSHNYNSMSEKGKQGKAGNLTGIATQVVNLVIFQNTGDTGTSIPRLLPLELDLKLDGISCIFQGNGFYMDVVKNGGVMPNRYQNQVQWQVTKVNHSITDSGWETTIKAMMRNRPS